MRLLLLAAFVVGCSNPAAPSTLPPRTIAGTFTLTQGDDIERTATDCRGTDGYSDVRSGLTAVVKDDAGKIVGKGDLVAEPSSGQTSADKFLDLRRCVFDFTVRDLPDVPFYTVEVGKRGTLTYSRAEMESAGWKVALTLGE